MKRWNILNKTYTVTTFSQDLSSVLHCIKNLANVFSYILGMRLATKGENISLNTLRKYSCDNWEKIVKTLVCCDISNFVLLYTMPRPKSGRNLKTGMEEKDRGGREEKLMRE